MISSRMSSAFSLFVASRGIRFSGLHREGRFASAISFSNSIQRPGATKDEESRPDKFDQKTFTKKQKEMSSKLWSEEKEFVQDGEERHVKHQIKVFDEMSSFFASADSVPSELIPVHKYLAERIIQEMVRGETTKATYHLLDIGCGTGVLWSFYLEVADAMGISLKIFGLDLAPKMVEQAQIRATMLMEESKQISTNDHSIEVGLGDINKWVDENEMYHRFDATVSNACFGNFWDSTIALEKMAQSLSVGGSLFITHPLGAEFVQGLHDNDETTVPNLLPSLADFNNLAKYLPLTVSHHMNDRIVLADSTTNAPVYFACATRVAQRLLPAVLHVRGRTQRGFGQAAAALSAKFPTKQLEGALAAMTPGVYFGWASIEGTGSTAKMMPFKAAVAISNSDTMDIHLLLNEEEKLRDHSDFDGEKAVRLQLHGVLQKEQGIPSDLNAQTLRDLDDVKRVLDVEPFASLNQDPFLQVAESDTCEEWTGSGGGDHVTSWEFVNYDSIAALERDA